MTIRRVGDIFIADTARVVGEVTLGRDVNIWYGVAIRGDVAAISIGERTNVQDNAVIHCDHDRPQAIGCDVVIGHSAIVHGVAVGDGSLIGMGAKVLGGVRIGKRCLVAAGAVVPPGLDVPDDHVVMGLPGRVKRETSDDEKTMMRHLVGHYVKLAILHADHADDVRVRAITNR